ncbi:hypothetical protein F0562_023834 [Nyssa sinensis]|uniref:K Homology domain-containing protein n=1 Tax=Nyssa sinensis TaxID=561372 RepID=A0A5J5BLH7_9ASTE|nr:hypothetical protein F0562_023834 [Nyssa sinensis]
MVHTLCGGYYPGNRGGHTKGDVGASLHARIVKANTGMNPELSCTDVLEALGKKLSFEMAVGLNGRVWEIHDYPFQLQLPCRGRLLEEVHMIVICQERECDMHAKNCSPSILGKYIWT